MMDLSLLYLVTSVFFLFPLRMREQLSTADILMRQLLMPNYLPFLSNRDARRQHVGSDKREGKRVLLNNRRDAPRRNRDPTPPIYVADPQFFLTSGLLFECHILPYGTTVTV